MRLADAPIGCVPIVWNNVDLPDLAPLAPHDEILDAFQRLGYAGTQYGRGFPEGPALSKELADRGLRFAELYSALPAGPNGMLDGAEDVARADLERLHAANGEVLVVALDGSADRDAVAGRVHGTDAPRWPAAAFDRLVALLDELAGAAREGVRVAFHPHTATWIEAPDEVELLAERLPGTRAGLCLDVGHYLAGGGDPVAAIERYGSLVRHVHVKDVDPAVLERLRSGEIDGFGGAVRERIFTEPGNGALDLVGVVRALDRIGFDGWLMVEQDST
ncbi:MAG: sugar phosphate isomerase/epimerase, partial [Chloroflexota bacterium]|nr:sugar phosphate isomerase/epimerase [Chloroflexota bacterium]